MSTSFSILGAVVVFAAAQLLLRKDAPAYAFLLSVGAALFVLLQLGATVQELLRNVLAFSRRVDGPAFACLLRCAGILLLTDYARTLCEEVRILWHGAPGLRADVWFWRQHFLCWKRSARRSGGLPHDKKIPAKSGSVCIVHRMLSGFCT